MAEFQQFVAYIFDALSNVALWENFQQLSYSNEILMIVGGLLALFGVLRIIKNSFKMLFWVLLSALGLASFSYGMSGSSIRLQDAESPNVAEYLETGANISNDVLQLMCTKLGEFQEETLNELTEQEGVAQ